MLILNPQQVSFGGSAWDGVESVVVDRLGHRLVQEWGDEGPWVVFVDVPESRVRVVLRQRLAEGALSSPKPGDSGLLQFEAAASESDAGRVSVEIEAVVAEVRHDLSRSGGVRSISLWAVSSNGSVDPVSVGGES
jgi:hypothetical protein